MLPIDDQLPAATWGEAVATHGDPPAKLLAALVEQSAQRFLEAQDAIQREGVSAEKAAAALAPLWADELQLLREAVPVILADMALTAPDAAATAWH